MTPFRIFAPIAALGLLGCGRGGEAVVVYTSVDDIFARPVMEAFERESGIRVEAVYDVEATKTTGLYHRLLAEKARPRADVFWNSEIARTLQLEKAGILTPYASPSSQDIPAPYRPQGAAWIGFGLRARVLVYNKEIVPPQEIPRSIRDLAAERFRGAAAIANPLFGTTATHAGALRAKLGRERMEEYFRALIANGVKVLAGNSVVRDRVVSGEIKVGLVDSDDAHMALQKGGPLRVVFPDQEPLWPGVAEPLGTFLIPNTVALVAGGPHPEGAKRFIDFLLRWETEELLARGESAQIPVRSGLQSPPLLEVPENLRGMDVPCGEVARGVEEAFPFLQELLVR